jgi:hypothetical protein
MDGGRNHIMYGVTIDSTHSCSYYLFVYLFEMIRHVGKCRDELDRVGSRKWSTQRYGNDSNARKGKDYSLWHAGNHAESERRDLSSSLVGGLDIFIYIYGCLLVGAHLFV